LLAGVAVLAEPQVPGDLGRAGQLTLDAHRPATIRLAHLGLVEAELVDQLVVAGDGVIRRGQWFVGEHAAQPGQAAVPG
jgi:hypothetical protein